MGDEQREYVVRWEMPVTAGSPRAAAEAALAIMRDPESIATYFEVFPGEPAEHDAIIVDLEPDTTQHEAYHQYELTGDERLRTVM